MNTAVAIIPARYASTRLPGKPLLDRTGLPMICHVVERARQAQRVSRVIVATDDQRIISRVLEFGGEAVMTRLDHVNGTSRIAEVAQTLGPEVDIIVNVQGDEPQVNPAIIDQVIARLREGDEPMATLASPFELGEDPLNPNIVKVALNQRGCAMYFSRSPIPYDRDRTGSPLLKHAGLYAYQRGFLNRYIALPPTPAEQAEKLEQLRALEHGYPIAVVVGENVASGIDTVDQYEEFVQRYQRHAR